MLRCLPLLLALCLPAACVPKQAITEAEASLMTDPTSAEKWVTLGDVYQRAGKDSEAARCFETALGLAPNDPAIRERLNAVGGRELSELERQALADPGNDELWGDLGDRYSSRGDTETALKYYLYAMRIDPADTEWQEKVISHGGAEEALAMVEAGLNPNDDESLGDVADLLVGAGQVERACELYAQANQLDPSDGEWHEKLATNCPNYEAVGAYEGYGDTGYMGGIEGGLIGGIVGGTVYSDNESELAAGRDALRRGDTAAAAEHFDAALHAAPTDREALSGLMVATGRTATDILSELVDEFAGDDELWGDLGDAWLAIGELSKARTAYQRAASLDPGDSEWRRQLDLLDAMGLSDPL